MPDTTTPVATNTFGSIYADAMRDMRVEDALFFVQMKIMEMSDAKVQKSTGDLKAKNDRLAAMNEVVSLLAGIEKDVGPTGKLSDYLKTHQDTEVKLNTALANAGLTDVFSAGTGKGMPTISKDDFEQRKAEMFEEAGGVIGVDLGGPKNPKVSLYPPELTAEERQQIRDKVGAAGDDWLKAYDASKDPSTANPVPPFTTAYSANSLLLVKNGTSGFEFGWLWNDSKFTNLSSTLQNKLLQIQAYEKVVTDAYYKNAVEVPGGVNSKVSIGQLSGGLKKVEGEMQSVQQETQISMMRLQQDIQKLNMATDMASSTTKKLRDTYGDVLRQTP